MAFYTSSAVAMVALVLVVVAAVTTGSPIQDQKEPMVGYCFRQRAPITKSRGRCTEEIRGPDGTALDAADCCLMGGAGWAPRASGKRCVDACSEADSGQGGPGLLSVFLKSKDLKTPNDSGSWSEWGEWSNCSAQCGVGTVTRWRTCPGNQNCSGSSEETNPCDTNATCLVNGGWSDWSDWTPCSNDGDFCADKTRTRTCTNPTPLFGGRPCHGRRTQTEFCNNGASQSCPVDGGWSEWVLSPECSGNCPAEFGWTFRSRRCDNPSPRRGGANCVGLFFDTVICKLVC